MKTKKKRKPQDLTLRNLRAMKKRVERLEFQMLSLLTCLAVGIDRQKFLDIKRR